jgi:hypothetical protein
MAKPSIFSRNYEQQMKRRRINMILFILIIICASYFGAKYYMDKRGIVLFKSKPKVTDQKNNNENSKVTITPTKAAEQGSSQNVSVTPTPGEYFEYKLSDGRSCRAEYTKSADSLQYTGLSTDNGDVFYNISIDKKYIVFEDVKGGNIVLGDSTGAFKVINPSVYKSKSTGKVIDKVETMKLKPEYIWARKPHFTTDNKVIYISDLPYLKSQGTLFVWTLTFDGGLNKMSGQLPTIDINKVSYGNFDASGRLPIIVNGSSYYLAPGSFTLVK